MAGERVAEVGEEQIHPVRTLEQEHDLLTGWLTVLADLCDRADAGATPAELEKELDSLADLVRDEIDVHSNKEEIGLFPALRRHEPPEGLVEKLLNEHGDIREFLHDFVSSAGAWLGGQDGRDASSWTHPARQLRGQLSTHIQKENLILFPYAKRVLTAGELDELRAVFKRMEE